MDEQMREKFEAWAMHPEREMDVRHDKLQPETGYIDYTTEWAWSAWQAAAALSQPAAQPTLWCLNYLGEPNALYMNREEAEAELARRNKFFPFDAEDRSIVGYTKATP